jgi:tetratricopeptide (TPR) repeat protein
MAAGEIEEARAYLDQLRAASPDDEALALIDAALTAAEGEVEASEAMLRAMLEAAPDAEGAARMLHRQLLTQGRGVDAAAVLDAAIAANPTSRALRLVKAGESERMGDYEEAIELYEVLYAENSSDVIVANNLASVLTVYRDDAESLERATAVAQRLRGTDVAPFQDTYGWIAYRRGAYAEALEYLEPAARGLPTNPLVQYHLGMTYRAVGRDAEAAEALTTALDLAEDRDLPQFETARAVLAEIEASSAAGTEPELEAPAEAGTADGTEAPTGQ